MLRPFPPRGETRGLSGAGGPSRPTDGGAVRRRDGTQHDHSLETETDVGVRRLVAAAGDRCVTIGWDYPGRTLLEVRILRRPAGPAGADEVRVAAGTDAPSGAAAGPDLVYQDVTGSFRDEGLENGRTYVYSVSARHPGGAWVPWDDLELTPATGAAAPAGRGAVRTGLLLLACVWMLALGAALPALAEDGGTGAEGSGETQAAASEAQAAAWDLATSDALVTGLLDGRQPETSAADAEAWPATDPDGATVYLLWSGGPGLAIDAELPVVRRHEPDEPPASPYVVVDHRVRASEVTGLRVLVDLRAGRVLEVYPWDEHADYVLHEDTTSPFALFPWFTSNAWVLLPVFGAAALYLGVRAWLRSRAWRRRLPSMSRHDRQFVGRMVVALLMMAAVVVMAVAIWRAVSVPILDPDRTVGGDLSAWPLILFPPLLYVAGIGLELTGGPHRVAWGLVAALAAVSCVYALIAMQAATVTNLTLLYYVLLGCLALVTIPRAFAPGKLGWSRSMGRAGG
jgi:hypothetical protein